MEAMNAPKHLRHFALSLFLFTILCGVLPQRLLADDKDTGLSYEETVKYIVEKLNGAGATT
jgi:hypothetical protein